MWVLGYNWGELQVQRLIKMISGKRLVFLFVPCTFSVAPLDGEVNKATALRGPVCPLEIHYAGLWCTAVCRRQRLLLL